MATQGEDVYATLLLSNSYLPGALVLAQSLRDAGTKKKLAVLTTADSISADVITELWKVYDYVIPVERIVNPSPANLFLMDRPDLQSAFTKIALWRQLQFRRIVYMDADMVALRAPDELFNITEPFSAAPDIGWPDLFNTGLMVLSPNMGDYYALLAMAQRGISFDGADQGLLNMYFKDSYNRISFTYNVTPSAHYQYIPAFRHFQSSITAAHFIGKEKPWTQGRDASKESSSRDELTGRWWAVYDRHYRESSAVISGQGSSPVVQQYVEGEYQPPSYGYSSSQQSLPAEAHREIPSIEGRYRTASYSYSSIQQSLPAETHSEMPTVDKEEYRTPSHGYSSAQQTLPAKTHLETPSVETFTIAPDAPIQVSGDILDIAPEEPQGQPTEEYVEEKGKEREGGGVIPPYTAWDPAREPPPSDSKPEASNFPAMHYEMSSDRTQFKAPEKYPEPPSGMYYEVPKTPTYQKPTPIFPWEKDAPKPTRVFADDDYYIRPKDNGSKVAYETEEPAIPTTPAVGVTPADPWQSFRIRSNAWDDMPEIERYIGALQRNRKGSIQVLQGYGSGSSQMSGPGGRRHSMKLTDFPTELERPSLPVTPAPIRRPSFWGEERDVEGQLPAAEGVPAQAEWDPAVQLDILARWQSEVLTNRLWRDDSGREIPSRPLPYGSEGVTSPTYVPPMPPSQARGASATHLPYEMKTKIEEPSYTGPGAMWEKGETFPTPEIPLGASEEEQDALQC